MQHSSLTKEEIRQILQGGGPLLTLGVSGMGMRALAALLCDLGHTVVGYDRAADATLDARVRLIDDPSTLTLSDYSLVFYTLAMGEEWEGLRDPARLPCPGARSADGGLFAQHCRRGQPRKEHRYRPSVAYL